MKRVDKLIVSRAASVDSYTLQLVYYNSIVHHSLLVLKLSLSSLWFCQNYDPWKYVLSFVKKNPSPPTNMSPKCCAKCRCVRERRLICLKVQDQIISTWPDSTRRLASSAIITSTYLLLWFEYPVLVYQNTLSVQNSRWWNNVFCMPWLVRAKVHLVKIGHVSCFFCDVIIILLP